MRAASVKSANVIEVVEMEIPKDSMGEALIEVIYGGICGSDLHVFHGQHPTAQFPVIAGHEFVGRLISMNGSAHTDRKDISIGDFVVAQPYTTCKHCSVCITGNDNVCKELKLLGAHRDGCFGEYAIVDANKVYKLPSGVDLKLATLAEPLAVAVHDVRVANVKFGDKVLIIGGGVIGVMIAIVARMSGAEICVSEPSEYRRNFIENLGFKAYNPLEDEYESRLFNVTGDEGFDVVFEVSGSRHGIASTVNFAKILGTIIIVGMSKEAYPVDTTLMFLKQVKMRGVRIHSQEHFKVAVDMLKNEKLTRELSKLISGEYRLDEIDKAYDYMKNHDDFFKLLLTMETDKKKEM